MNLLFRYPALAVLMMAWLPSILLVSITPPLYGVPITTNTWLLIVTCVAASAIGIVSGAPRAVVTQAIITPRAPALLMVIGGASGLAYWYLTKNSGLTLEESRNLLLSGQFVQSPLESYLYQAGGSFSFLSVALAVQTDRPVRYLILTLSVAVLSWIGMVLNTGGRVVIMALIATALCGVISKFPRKAFSWRGIVAGMALISVIIFVNVVFVEKRMASLFANASWNEQRYQRLQHFSQLQSKKNEGADFLITSIWLLQQFTSDPLYYLDYFLSSERRISGGLYQFGILANRFPGYDWNEVRAEIDSINLPLGITYNVWGTSIRDVVIDFGRFGAPFFYFIIGYISSKSSASPFVSSKVIHLFTVVWFLYMPFHSPISIRPLQMAFFIVLIWRASLFFKKSAKKFEIRSRDISVNG